MSPLKVKLCIIDSGIDLDEPLFQHKSIFPLQLSGNNLIRQSDNKNCEHGTICARLIFSESEVSEFYSIKIFSETQRTYTTNLINALISAYEIGVNIINLSIGLYNSEYLKELYEVCRYITDNNVMIVASNEATSNNKVFPACFSNVLGVEYSNNVIGNNYQLRLNNPIQCLANGFIENFPQSSQKFNYKIGSSFATARMTSVITKIMIENSLTSIDEVFKYLWLYSDLSNY